MKTENSIATYEERAEAANRELVPERVSRIKKAFGTFHQAAGQIQNGTIDGANSSLDIGLELQGWCGHENMKLIFWKAHCEKTLPFDFDAANFFMSVARKMKKKAETLADAWEFSQLILTFDGQLALPERVGQQMAARIPPLQKLCCQFVMLRKPLEKIYNVTPCEDWDLEDIRLALSETEWLAFERQRWEQLAKAKKSE